MSSSNEDYGTNKPVTHYLEFMFLLFKRKTATESIQLLNCKQNPCNTQPRISWMKFYHQERTVIEAEIFQVSSAPKAEFRSVIEV